MKNLTHKKKNLVLLIMADMCNRKFIMGLDAIGLSTDDFNTNLSSFIFEKMNIPSEHETYIGNWYEDIVYTFLDIDFKTFKEHQFVLATTLYDAILAESLKFKKVNRYNSNLHAAVLECAAFPRFDN